MSNMNVTGGGVQGAGPIGGLPAETPADTSAETETAGATGAPSRRAKSVDMQGLDLAARLDAQLAASSGGGSTPAPTVPAEPKKKDPLNGWTIGASFGPRWDKFEPVDVRIKNDRVDVSIEGVNFLQRTSMEYYKFWEAEKAADIMRWVDEPTNQTQLEAKKAGWVVGVRAYHPKMLVSLGGDGQPNLNTSVHMQGTVEGKPVDANVDLKDTFGAIHLTHKLMNYEVYGGKEFTLAQGKAGSLKLATEIGGGVYAGRVSVNYRDPNDYWKFVSYDDSKTQLMGGSVTLKSSLTYMLSGGHVGFGAEADITRGAMKYDMMGGTTSHAVKSESFAVFVKVEF